MAKISKGFPHTPLMFSIGNNDLWPNNFNSPRQFQRIYSVLEETCKTCTLFLGDNKAVDRMKNTFTNFGYYSWHDPAKKARFLSLNSGMWSDGRYDNSELDKSAVEDQMRWVEHELEKARQLQERVVVIGHVPPVCFLA
jgi:hypothetical protein